MRFARKPHSSTGLEVGRFFRKFAPVGVSCLQSEVISASHDPFQDVLEQPLWHRARVCSYVGKRIVFRNFPVIVISDKSSAMDLKSKQRIFSVYISDFFWLKPHACQTFIFQALNRSKASTYHRPKLKLG